MESARDCTRYSVLPKNTTNAHPNGNCFRVRFAIATTDRYLDVFQVLVARAWKPVKVFTCPAR